jgi:DNA-binding response OmpR family regulator
VTTERNQEHILVVDDEAAVRTLLRECFEPEGYRVSEARDGAAALALLAAGAVDLITLDLGLGGENGLELARRIRSAHNLPIVMITGKGDTIDRVVGLELGADDYIAKPFHLREVLARVRAVLRRYQAPMAGRVDVPDPVRYRFADWVLDAARRELKAVDGESRELSTAEFDLLLIFLDQPGRVLSRDTIMDLLKGHDWTPYDRTIDTLVVRLRRKVEPDPETPRLIKTVRGVGYVFTEEVRRS